MDVFRSPEILGTVTGADRLMSQVYCRARKSPGQGTLAVPVVYQHSMGHPVPRPRAAAHRR